MNLQFIKSPSPGTLAILNRRVASRTESYKNVGAVGLVQGQLADMLMAADVAEKVAHVMVEEIRGICPQHITMIAIFGDIAAVDTAIKAVKEYFNTTIK